MAISRITTKPNANALRPCAGTSVFSGSVTFKAGFAEVLSIGEDKSDAPTAYVTDVNISKTASGGGRIVVANISDQPNLTITATPQFAAQGTTLTFSPVRRGGSTWQDAKAINYIAQITQFNTTNNLGFPLTVRPVANSVFMIFAFGSAKTGSIRLAAKAIEDVF